MTASSDFPPEESGAAAKSFDEANHRQHQATASPRLTVSDSVQSASILAAIFIWALSCFLVAWFEFGVFWTLPLQLFAMNLDWFDQSLVVGSLLARTLLVTAPLAALVLFSIRRRFGWKPKLLIWSLHCLVLAWIVIDCGLQCVTGANIWHYVQKAMTTDDLAVGGDVNLLIAGIKSALRTLSFQIAAIAVLTTFATKLLARSRWNRLIPTAVRCTTAGIAVAVLAIFVARPFVSQRPALEQLYGTITLRTWLFHPDRIAVYGESAFGKNCEHDFHNLNQNLERLFRSDVCEVASSDNNIRPKQSSQVIPSTLRLAKTSSATHLDTSGTFSPDFSALDLGVNRPNIIVLLTESFRHTAVNAATMPQLFHASKNGLVATQHTTNSNCSEFGAFTSLYGRYALCYDDVLDHQVPSIGMQHLKRLGYRRRMINSCSVNFARMNEFLSQLNFDDVSIHNPTGNPWHDNDRLTLNEVADVVNNAKTPQFVFSILMATHYSYDYPEEYDRLMPNGRPAPANSSDSYELLEDRYWKSIWYLDQQISKLLKEVEGTNTIVVVTGDHGESFLDDGFLCHGTRLSEIQTRTPLLILGDGISCETVSTPTGHIDLMPTILDLAQKNAAPNCDDSKILWHGPGQSVFNFAQDGSRKTNDSAKSDQENSGENRSMLMVQTRINDCEIALLHPEGTLALQTSRDGRRMNIMGFLNKSGRIDQSQRRGPEEIPVWNRRLRAAFESGAAHANP